MVMDSPFLPQLPRVIETKDSVEIIAPEAPSIPKEKITFYEPEEEGDLLAGVFIEHGDGVLVNNKAVNSPKIEEGFRVSTDREGEAEWNISGLITRLFSTSTATIST